MVMMVCLRQGTIYCYYRSIALLLLKVIFIVCQHNLFIVGNRLAAKGLGRRAPRLTENNRMNQKDIISLLLLKLIRSTTITFLLKRRRHQNK
jgi:hypothetical protein